MDDGNHVGGNALREEVVRGSRRVLRHVVEQRRAALALDGEARRHALGVLDVVGSRLVHLAPVGLGGDGEAEVFDLAHFLASILSSRIVSQPWAPGESVTAWDSFLRRDASGRGCGLTEAIAVALVSGLMTLLGVLVSNSRSRAVMEVKIDELRRQVEKHNSLIERTYRLEQDVAVLRNDVESIRGRD